MLENGNKCGGKKLGNENLKATIPSTDMKNQKQPENVEHFNCFGSKITNMQDARVKLSPILPWQKQHSTSRLSTSTLDLNLMKKLVLHLEHSPYGAETWTLPILHHKHLESFEMWCCRKMKIIWTDRVRNGVLQEFKEERNILHTIKRRTTELVTYYVGTASKRRYWRKHIERKKWRKEDEEEVRS